MENEKLSKQKKQYLTFYIYLFHLSITIVITVNL